MANEQREGCGALKCGVWGVECCVRHGSMLKGVGRCDPDFGCKTCGTKRQLVFVPWLSAGAPQLNLRAVPPGIVGADAAPTHRARAMVQLAAPLACLAAAASR
eukprot:183380-Chlamydomonas_euryale.AAC.1